MSADVIADGRFAQLAERVEELSHALDESRRRLQHVERQRRRWPVGAVVLACAWAGMTSLGAQSNPILSGRFKTPFEVVDPNGRTIMNVQATESGAGYVQIGNPNTGGITIGVGASGAGYLLLRAANGVNQVSIGQADGGPMGVRVMSPDGKTTLARLGLDNSARGLLTVGDLNAGGIATGTGASGSGFFLLRSPEGRDRISMGQAGGGPMGVHVNAADGKTPLAVLGTGRFGGYVQAANPSGAIRAAMAGDGSLELSDAAGNTTVGAGAVSAGGGGVLSVYQTADSKLFEVSGAVAPGAARVTVGPGAGGGIAVGVANAAKATVAVFGESKIGGGVFAASDTSGTIRALLSGSVGELHMADEAGVTRATVVAASAGGGAVSIRSASGTTLARLGGLTTGMFQLSEAGGNAIVEAGTLPTGVGVVRAYPLGSSGQGVVGMPGTFIMGRSGGK